MPARELEIETPDGAMPLYEATPTGTAKGGVVVIQEIFGVNEHMQDVTRRFADAGFHAVAPALYHREGSPTPGYNEFDKAKPLLDNLKAPEILTDVDAALAHLAEAGFSSERSGIVGFCMGGSVSIYVAANRTIGAAVAFYGGGLGEGRMGMPALADLGPELKTPLLGLFGDLDQSILVEQVEKLRANASQASVESEIVRYPEAGHGFHCDARPQAHNPEASKDAWARTVAFLEKHLGA